MKFYFIAGENSGDNIAGLLITQLKEIYKDDFQFKAIGGSKVQSHGVKSLFPMSDLSIMGFFEILPKIFLLKRRINETIEDIMKYLPDVVITVDSPAFSIRVAKSLRSRGYKGKLVHVIAPSVWAYKPKRAKLFAQYYDQMLAILPFEPKYFLNEGLDCKYVGHFALENNFCADSSYFREKYNLTSNDLLLLLTPGSRDSEIKNHLSIFVESAQKFRQKMVDKGYDLGKFSVVIADVNAKIMNFPIDENINFIIERENIFESYAAADLAIAKSGTNVVEIAAHSTPLLVGYRMNFFTWLYIKNAVKIKFASIINIIAGFEVIAEFIQNKCTSDNLSDKLVELAISEIARKRQLVEVEKILSIMKDPSSKPPSLLSAEYICQILEDKDKRVVK